MWSDEEEESEKETEDHAKLVETRAEVQYRGNPLHWASVSVSYAPPHPTPHAHNEKGIRGAIYLLLKLLGYD